MVYHFTSREKNILHYLSISDTYILGKQLAAVTGESERTIRDDIKRINQVLFSEELDDFFELDDNFHQLLTQIADCQLAWDTIENLKATVDRVRYMSFDHVSPPEMLLRQHLDIFSALQKRDGDAVERAMTQHLQEISESVRQIRQENSDWFSEE